MITNQNARLVDVKYVIDANGTKRVLVVGTDLQLDPPEIGFDKAAVDALCFDLERRRASNPYIDAVWLVRRRGLR
jgi:hypothetical protein